MKILECFFWWINAKNCTESLKKLHFLYTSKTFHLGCIKFSYLRDNLVSFLSIFIAWYCLIFHKMNITIHTLLKPYVIWQIFLLTTPLLQKKANQKTKTIKVHFYIFRLLKFKFLSFSPLLSQSRNLLLLFKFKATISISTKSSKSFAEWHSLE